jgi:hypothetical protein
MASMSCRRAQPVPRFGTLPIACPQLACPISFLRKDFVSAVSYLR